MCVDSLAGYRGAISHFQLTERWLSDRMVWHVQKHLIKLAELLRISFGWRIIRRRFNRCGVKMAVRKTIKKFCLFAFLFLVSAASNAREVVLLYTNDIESVYEPVESVWREDIDRMGGMAYLAALIRQRRDDSRGTFLVDAGDIFTGSLSKATKGRLPFDLYSTMGYDAVNLGNHEFEYGWQTLLEVMQRARFPVLNANIYHEASQTNFARQYAILEKEGVRVGVIGSMGMDAFLNTMMKSNRAGLVAKPPIAVLQGYIDTIRAEVDLVVLLTPEPDCADADRQGGRPVSASGV